MYVVMYVLTPKVPKNKVKLGNPVRLQKFRGLFIVKAISDGGDKII